MISSDNYGSVVNYLTIILLLSHTLKGHSDKDRLININ